jgi:hypothetical protein
MFGSELYAQVTPQTFHEVTNQGPDNSHKQFGWSQYSHGLQSYASIFGSELYSQFCAFTKEIAPIASTKTDNINFKFFIIILKKI